MSLVFYDRVKQPIVAFGTSALSFTTPIVDYITFENANIGNNVFPYVIANSSQFEVGIGSYISIANSGTAYGVLSRITVLSNSNLNNNFVSFNGSSANAAITNAAELSVLVSSQPVANTLKLIQWSNNQYNLIDPVFNAPSLGGSINSSIITYNSSTGYFQADPNLQFYPGNFPELYINGVIQASVKMFKIPHPTKPNKWLVHGCLEGPENGIYLRGSTFFKNKLIVYLPDYFINLNAQENYTVLISYDSFWPVKFRKHSDKIEFICFNPFKNIQLDYIVFATRANVMFNVEQ
jgi:hypothetical protein